MKGINHWARKGDLPVEAAPLGLTFAKTHKTQRQMNKT
jgi:hypothetical protein